MRRLFIFRKDLNLSPGKLAAMTGHCAEAYWTDLLVKNAREENGKIVSCVELDPAVFREYLDGSFTKTVCQAKNLNQLLKARTMALELGLTENEDFGMIDDACRTELSPEFTDENGEGRCTVGIWFKPLEDEKAHEISRKFQLYRA